MHYIQPHKKIMTFCSLCNSERAALFYQDNDREYLHCENCNLVFVPPQYFLSPEEEKIRYDLHENSPDDNGYRDFLGRLFVPLNKLLSPKSSGLDFGSGPGPTLSVMFEEHGHTMGIFDSFFANNEDVFNRKYDFITATEVFEHLHNPIGELDRLWSCLKSGGYLGVMTKLVIDKERFEKWHYKDDLTHVSFYSQETFEWLARYLNATISFFENDVIIFRKIKR
ncbi:MAG: methyltransferase domain-containing protein [Candidatus Ancaeobacter aquaticus]|nr:methyltransferase domain-containing protein [Candidatus Ancaeobacter aquaticus]